MKYKTLLFTLIILLSFSFASAALDNAEAYWSWDNTLTDSSGNGNTLTNSGSTYTASGKINGAYSYDGTNDQMSFSGPPTHSAYTYSTWAYLDTNPTSIYRFALYNGRTADGIGIYDDAGTIKLIGYHSGSAGTSATYTGSFTGSWMHIASTWDGSRQVLYLNGAVVANISNSAAVENFGDPFRAGAFGGGSGAYFWDGRIDEGAYYQRALSSSEITDLYNSGTGCNPYTTTCGATPSTSAFEVTATDQYTTSSLTNFTAEINGTNYSTTNGTVVTDILNNATTLYDVKIISTQNGGYFNRTYSDYNVSIDLAAEVHQAEIIFTASNLVTDFIITNPQISDFETGLGDWTASGGATTSTNWSTTGTQSVSIYEQGAGIYQDNWNMSLVNNMSFDYNVSLNGNGLFVYIFNNGTDGPVTNRKVYSLTTDGSGTANIDLDGFITGTRRISISTDFCFPDGCPQNYVYVDNIRINGKPTEFTVTAPNSDTSTAINPELNVTTGSLTYIFNKTGYYNTELTASLSALERGTANFEVYTNLLNVTITSLGSATENNFTITLDSLDYDYTTTQSTTTGYLELGLIPGEYNVTVNDSIHTLESELITINSTSNYTELDIEVYSTNTVNITFIDELTDNLITENVTAFITGSIESYEYTTSNGTIFAELLEPDSYIITYSAPSYEQRQYAFTLTNRSYNQLTLYLINSTEDDLIQFTVQDTLLNPLTDYTVRAQRKNLSGTNYYTVETCNTDSNGQCVQRLQLYDVTYRFVIENSAGNVVFTSSDQQISSTSVTFNIQITSDPLSTIENIYEITGDVSYSTVNDQFSFTWNDPNGLDTEGCLDITRTRRGVTNTISSQCSTSSSGTITYSQDLNNSYTWNAEGYVNIDGNKYVIDTLSIAGDEEIGSVLGNQGLFLFGFLVVMIAAFLGLFNPVIPPITIIGLIFILNLLGFITLGAAAITSIIVAGVMVIYLARS